MLIPADMLIRAGKSDCHTGNPKRRRGLFKYADVRDQTPT